MREFLISDFRLTNKESGLLSAFSILFDFSLVALFLSIVNQSGVVFNAPLSANNITISDNVSIFSESFASLSCVGFMVILYRSLSRLTDIPRLKWAKILTCGHCMRNFVYFDRQTGTFGLRNRVGSLGSRLLGRGNRSFLFHFHARCACIGAVASFASVALCQPPWLFESYVWYFAVSLRAFRRSDGRSRVGFNNPFGRWFLLFHACFCVLCTHDEPACVKFFSCSLF